MSFETKPETKPPTELDRLVADHDEFVAFVMRRVGDPTLAQDIVQDAFAKAVTQLPHLRQLEAARPWFYRVLRNACVESYRHRGRSQRALAKVAANAEHAPAELAFDAVPVGCRCVGRIAESLKPEYADALSQIDIEGVAIKAFAEARGITPNNARVRIHRARKLLARELADGCGACASLGCDDCTCEG